MDSTQLASQKCVPCQVGAPPLSAAKIRENLKALPQWQLIDSDRKIQKTFQFADFVSAMAFVNRVADIAEHEGHHPDLSISWNRVTATLYTHKINGLHENDFILAAKIETVVQA